jgi:hypothetical protein
MSKVQKMQFVMGCILFACFFGLTIDRAMTEQNWIPTAIGAIAMIGYIILVTFDRHESKNN